MVGECDITMRTLLIVTTISTYPCPRVTSSGIEDERFFPWLFHVFQYREYLGWYVGSLESRGLERDDSENWIQVKDKLKIKYSFFLSSSERIPLFWNNRNWGILLRRMTKSQRQILNWGAFILRSSSFAISLLWRTGATENGSGRRQTIPTLPRWTWQIPSHSHDCGRLTHISRMLPHQNLWACEEYLGQYVLMR